MDLTRDFIEKIEQMSKANIHEIGGFNYTDKRLSIINELHPETLYVNSLSSLIRLVKAEKQHYNLPIIINVDEADRVTARSSISEQMERDVPFCATAMLPNIVFERYISIEEMIISLKSKFVQTETTEKVVSLIGNITNTESVTTKDDGFTQNVEARRGIAMVQNVDIEPIVELQPYRTFLEVEQPKSKFLFRLKDGNAALFEADGGKWKLEAKNNIYEYLMASFDGENDIIITK